MISDGPIQINHNKSKVAGQSKKSWQENHSQVTFVSLNGDIVQCHVGRPAVSVRPATCPSTICSKVLAGSQLEPTPIYHQFANVRYINSQFAGYINPVVPPAKNN